MLCLSNLKGGRYQLAVELQEWRGLGARAAITGSAIERGLHPHTVGDPTPSQADIEMTRVTVEAAKPLGISVHDHVIVGKQDHASLRGLRLI